MDACTVYSVRSITVNAHKEKLFFFWLGRWHKGVHVQMWLIIGLHGKFWSIIHAMIERFWRLLVKSQTPTELQKFLG